MNRYLKTLRKVALACFCLLATTYLYFLFQVMTFDASPVVENADVAIVLGFKMNDGKPSPGFKERIHQGIRLYRSKKVKALLMTGGFTQHAEISEARAARDYAIMQGIPEANIAMEEKSRSTYENIKHAKEICKKYSWEDCFLVSDSMHLKRATQMAKDRGLHAYPCATSSSVHHDVFSSAVFYMREAACLMIYTFCG